MKKNLNELIEMNLNKEEAMIAKTLINKAIDVEVEKIIEAEYNEIAKMTEAFGNPLLKLIDELMKAEKGEYEIPEGVIIIAANPIGYDELSGIPIDEETLNTFIREVEAIKMKELEEKVALNNLLKKVMSNAKTPRDVMKAQKQLEAETKRLELENEVNELIKTLKSFHLNDETIAQAVNEHIHNKSKQ